MKYLVLGIMDDFVYKFDCVNELEAEEKAQKMQRLGVKFVITSRVAIEGDGENLYRVLTSTHKIN